MRAAPKAERSVRKRKSAARGAARVTCEYKRVSCASDARRCCFIMSLIIIDSDDAVFDIDFLRAPCCAMMLMLMPLFAVLHYHLSLRFATLYAYTRASGGASDVMRMRGSRCYRQRRIQARLACCVIERQEERGDAARLYDDAHAREYAR